MKSWNQEQASRMKASRMAAGRNPLLTICVFTALISHHRRAASGAARPTFFGPTKKPYVFAAPAVRPDVRSMRQQQDENGNVGVNGPSLDAEPASPPTATAAPPHLYPAAASGDDPVQRSEVSAANESYSNGVAAGSGKHLDAFQVAAGSFQVSEIVRLMGGTRS